ncbi:MAG: hypothetical protein R2828_22020 [Saprospiraceae bacterium]
MKIRRRHSINPATPTRLSTYNLQPAMPHPHDQKPPLPLSLQYLPVPKKPPATEGKFRWDGVGQRWGDFNGNGNGNDNQNINNNQNILGRTPLVLPF